MARKKRRKKRRKLLRRIKKIKTPFSLFGSSGKGFLFLAFIADAK